MHLLTSRVMAEAAAADGGVNSDKAALATKMAGTVAKQYDVLNRSNGRAGRQSIKVKYERHDHQHLHVEGGVSEILDNPAHMPRSSREIAAPIMTSPRCLTRMRSGSRVRARL
jgi:hypothetical protein